MADRVEDASLAALRGLRERRAEIDRAERDAIDAARAAGTSWATIATALGLASRQAAEQRRLRLDDAIASRDPAPARVRHATRRRVDATLGPAVADLRAAVIALRAALEDAAHDAGAVAGDRHGDGALVLARRTAALAVDAEAGPLVDLARHLVADLHAAGCPPHVARPLARVEKHLEALRGAAPPH